MKYKCIAISSILALLIFTLNCGVSRDRRVVAGTAEIGHDNPGEISPQPSGTELPELPEAARVIESFCESVSEAAERKGPPDRVFADISSNSTSEWKGFSSEKELEGFRKETETHTIAYFWRNDDDTILTNFTFFSESGDWVKYVTSCYRNDGSLAHAFVDFRTFYGRFAMHRNIYYAENGSEILRSEAFFGLFDEKPISPSQEDLDENEHRLIEEDHFKAVSALPFAGLLTKR